MMTKFQFRSHFLSLIMHYVQSISFQVLLNGMPMESFKPERGLRQRDPLSSFLFVLCAEGLSSLLRREMHKGNLKGLKMGINSSEISHFFFFCQMIA